MGAQERSQQLPGVALDDARTRLLVRRTAQLGWICLLGAGALIGISWLLLAHGPSGGTIAGDLIAEFVWTLPVLAVISIASGLNLLVRWARWRRLLARAPWHACRAVATSTKWGYGGRVVIALAPLGGDSGPEHLLVVAGSRWQMKALRMYSEMSLWMAGDGRFVALASPGPYRMYSAHKPLTAGQRRRWEARLHDVVRQYWQNTPRDYGEF